MWKGEEKGHAIFKRDRKGIAINLGRKVMQGHVISC